MTLRIIVLICVIILFTFCSRFNKAQKSDNIEFKYSVAEDYFKKKDYYRAGVLFEELIPLLRGSDMAENALFYYAYSQYYQGQLALSEYHFKRFYELYPRSERAEEAFFMHCKSLYLSSPDYTLDQTNTYEAIESIQFFVNRFPNSSYLDECNQMIDKCRRKLEIKSFENAKLYYKLGEYKAAIVAFTTFTKSYPDSPKIEEAIYYKLVSQYKLAQISIESKKLERYKATLEMYYEFVDKYPKSKLLKEVEYIYSNANSYINKFSTINFQ